MLLLRTATVLLLSLAPVQDAGPSDRPWEDVHAWLSGEAERFAGDLETAHAALLRRVEAEAPALLAKLDPEPPAPTPSGYGILPRLLPDVDRAAIAARERSYSLESLSTTFARDLRDAALLARRADDARRELEPLVDQLERLRARHVNLEQHLAYHAFWQEAVVDDAEYFAERNEVVALVRAWRDGQGPRTSFEERLAPFEPTDGLCALLDDTGTRVLSVRVVTDVDDDDFLATFAAAVGDAFAKSEAARARNFRVELSFDRLPAAELYPEGAPARGATVDEDDHRARFAPGALVLTTGAESTHSYIGRTIHLGSQPLTRRTLAHEFGHLLGFSDAYLRGYDGDPGDPYGAVLIEWHGLLDDLMGDPSRGRVTTAMIDRLIEAYAEP